VLASRAPFVLSAPATACTAPEYHQFDFWIGKWSVSDRRSHHFAGTNDITRELNTCVLQEHWVGRRGTRGMSFNIYDSSSRRWHQTWVDSNGYLLVLNGGLTGHSMVMTGMAPGNDGKMQLQRIEWTPQADGSVRQHWTSSEDNGKSWSDLFDGIYTKSPG
jgi:hypothetical protein